jgi:uncharacterized protein (TIGR03382 family)
LAPEVSAVSADKEATPRVGAALPDDPAGIEAEIARRRGQLAATVDELVVRAHPTEIARRGVADAKQRARAATTTEDGQLRVERIGAVVAAVLALVVLVVLLRRRRHD